ncbi:OsmC family protein [Dyadobacter frigoris]|uniref:OsmC family protein n=1 Tax=Dyadobacter frigoris TaxID=2576211 RepID=A0A4U6CZQ0_9BACT|nr:OsmC family protein [Dyadobacter frigoris]TKT86944.1 OsmC family protein [Dyadobacter frigoris]GLU56549.1 osmotically inducible protein C [Dyadobacter frigoris]
MAKVFASIGTALYKTEIKTATNSLVADEPVSAGGLDLGFSPEELLASALAACTCGTLRMYANRKGWSELIKINVHVEFSRDIQANVSQMNREIELIGDLNEEQKTRLLAIANKCPIHNTLTHTITIETTLT